MKAKQLTISTREDRWVIPYDGDLLKALLTSMDLSAHDLRFRSPRHCQDFVREVALLAAQDELRCSSPSTLATLTRELVIHNLTVNETQSASI